MCGELKRKKSKSELKHLENKKKRPEKHNARVEGVRISDDDLIELFEMEKDDETLAYGVDLNEDEKSFLKLHKCIAEFPKLDKEQMYTDVHVAAAKVRLDAKQKIENVGDNLTEEEQNGESKSIMVFNPETKELDFSNRRVTSMKTCRRVGYS